MEYKFNMTPEEQLQWEEYYKTQKLIFQTQFKGGRYVSDFVEGFSAHKFIGTWEEYEKATAIFNERPSLGKIIGTKSFTFEEWDKIHKKEPYKMSEENKKEFDRLSAKFEAEYQAKAPLRAKRKRDRELR